MTEMTIKPSYIINKTVSSPFEPAKVIGFEARNQRFGRDALLLKREERVNRNGDTVVVAPPELLESSDIEEVSIIADNSVSVMELDDFEERSSLHTFETDDGNKTLRTLRIDDDAFERYTRTDRMVVN